MSSPLAFPLALCAINRSTETPSSPLAVRCRDRTSLGVNALNMPSFSRSLTHSVTMTNNKNNTTSTLNRTPLPSIRPPPNANHDLASSAAAFAPRLVAVPASRRSSVLASPSRVALPRARRRNELPRTSPIPSREVVSRLRVARRSSSSPSWMIDDDSRAPSSSASTTRASPDARMKTRRDAIGGTTSRSVGARRRSRVGVGVDVWGIRSRENYACDGGYTMGHDSSFLQTCTF